ncbi:hypothetical protein FNF29_01766 [Cafeteria roenbergensis]|uniref:Uncharacterized protein n=1 Tax=Cafeteria roenbergensis TaxID=33653 RepID=A0A5A8CUD0_CAFRO|nr:hypothetical protein FNF29_01766 [Cafeteria roenbergensis]|eukprot:KAA0155391.1 hypothetical protein FNF29_01766 [Cafeteria roenbergensis]
MASRTAGAIARAFHEASSFGTEAEGSRRMEEALCKLRADGSLRLVSRGTAGGVKVSDTRAGAFFKIASDVAGIYKGSAVMADKAAKHELAALAFLHNVVDSPHLTVPVAACTDVTVRGPDGRPERVYRVQATSLLPLGRSTLRLGSEDANATANLSADCAEVARSLAAAFRLGPSFAQPRQVTVHTYARVALPRDPARLPVMGPESEALLERLGAGRAQSEATGVCAAVQAASGAIVDPLQPTAVTHSSETLPLRGLAAERLPVAFRAGGGGYAFQQVLPFDVEVHLLPTGERQALAAAEAAFPETHDVVQMALNALATSLRAQGNPQAAMRLLTRCLRLRAATDGSDSVGFAAALGNSASCMADMGKFSAAAESLARGLTIMAAALGHAHPSTLDMRSNLANALLSAGRSEEALREIRGCVAEAEAARGGDDPSLVAPLSALGACLTSRGRFDEAEPALRRAVQLAKRQDHGNLEALVAALGSLGDCLQSKGDLEEAVAAFRASADACAGLGQRGTALRAAAMSNAAICLKQQGSPAEAMRIHEEALAMQVQALGRSHLSCSVTRSEIAACMMSLGDDHGAIELLRECKAAALAEVGQAHPLYASASGNLALCLLSVGNSALAAEEAQDAAAAFAMTMGPDHPQTRHARDLVTGTTKRLSELDRRLDSIDAKPERQGGAPGAKSGGSESRTVKQLLETDEAQHVHSIQVRMSLAADDERQRMLADVGRPHDALERARAERGHPAPSASEHAAAAAEPFQGDASTEKPSAVRRLLRGIPCPPLSDSRPHVIALCDGASSKRDMQQFAAAASKRLLVTVVEEATVAVAAASDRRRDGVRCAALLIELAPGTTREVLQALRKRQRPLPTIIIAPALATIASRPDDAVDLRRATALGVDAIAERPIEAASVGKRILSLVRTASVAQAAFSE